MKSINFFIVAICILCSCQGNANKQGGNSQGGNEYFYGNISLTDNVETCLSKGLIQSTGQSVLNPTGYTLTSNYFKGVSYENSNVGVDNNRIKYIQLVSNYMFWDDRNGYDDTERIFNSTLQALCQEYSNMQTYSINTNENQGKGHRWETSNKVITLEYYTHRVNIPQTQTSIITERMFNGNYVELTFQKK